ncbi:hypothetical protein SDC9_157532 [bioreactor metagenome]|uniref:Uncharacterized protein n=1 Tax=bioreactor metagenome TaxID=1076179 RepID=A0A645F7N9_9ZZZZ
MLGILPPIAYIPFSETPRIIVTMYLSETLLTHQAIALAINGVLYLDILEERSLLPSRKDMYFQTLVSQPRYRTCTS